MARAWPWCFSLLLTRLVCSTHSSEDSSAITSCPTKADDVATLGSALLQVHKQQELVRLSDEQELLKLFAVLDRFDTSCFAEGTDVATRDAACTGQLVCARAGFDNRNFGDCPQNHCCSVDQPATNKERYDKTCYDGGSTMASRDASCKGALVCARPGFDSRNFGDCPQDHCCSVEVISNSLERYDSSCHEAGSDVASRDASCKGDLVCARPGFDNRAFGDCPKEHCCSVKVVTNSMERYDQLCYKAGSDMASRDAACLGDLVCARKGSDSRDFGDCPQHHCCSQQVITNSMERYDELCYKAGSDMASRDAACQGDLVCARKGSDSRDFGDCPQHHCCSQQVIENSMERYDQLCYKAGSDMASRDAACQGDLVCARKGFDSRDFGDCPQHHCCSQQVVEKSMERYDQLCHKAGSDMASRDAACQGNLVCARKGYDSRDFGDCPQHHCCSQQVVSNSMERYNKLCYKAGSNAASRDAACRGDLVCARTGFDNRKFGDCPKHHCCSQEVASNSLERYDKSCYKAGSDVASRDASCQGALVCARQGSDKRTFGDCPNHHCCSEQARKRFDTSCYQAGQDAAARDASCQGDLVCARKGHEGRTFGDCPGKHCCSSEVVSGKAIYGVGKDGLVYKQLLSTTSSWSPWSLVGAGAMSSITIAGDRIFATGSDKQVYVQQLSSMTPESSWNLAGKGGVHSIAVDAADMIYAVGVDGQVYKQTLSSMTPTSEWTWAGKGAVLSIAIEGETIYGTGTDHVVYKQPLSSLGEGEGAWSQLGTGFVRSITVDGDDIYGTGMSKKVWQQALSTMSPTSSWTLAATGDIVSIAVTSGADPGAALSL